MSTPRVTDTSELALGTRKLFRMGYEPCAGTCYTPGEVLSLHGMTPDEVDAAMAAVLELHGPACGNRNVRLGLDAAGELFIASFLHYGVLDLVTGDSPSTAILRLAAMVARHVQSPAWVAELAQEQGLGPAVCEHGQADALIQFALRHSGLEVPEIAAAKLALCA